MAAFIVASEVRDYLGIASTSGQYSAAVIGSNIRAASDYLQRRTGRQFEAQDATAKTFTTHNRASLIIPDLRTASSVVRDGSALEAGTTHHLLPDRRSSGIYTAIQFRVPISRDDGPWYLHAADWWDRGLDWEKRGYWSSSPNDLVVTGDWGYAAYPDELLHATKILAAFYTKRPDSVLAGVSVTTEGAVLSYRELPIEVRVFIDEWTLDEQAVAV